MAGLSTAPRAAACGLALVTGAGGEWRGRLVAGVVVEWRGRLVAGVAVGCHAARYRVRR
ncbi:hypothetical protein [Nonomuraea sp. PA05]|uniref:hypothetical protein n=1 Tax=Nonomuraea sp. PA05 TaxID=2604466 RepID=UPI001651D37B|nr:hypothetical protein [Nonomuraea sp. PA05]